MKSKKTILLLMTILLVTKFNYASIDTIRIDVNNYIKKEYQLPDYFDINNIFNKAINYDTYNEYQTLAYGSKHGNIKFSVISNKNEYRFFGEDSLGQNIPNYNYSYDTKSSIDFSDMKWLVNPYDNLIVTNDARFKWITHSPFNAYRNDLLPNFIAGMHEQHGNPLRPTGDMFDETKPVDWARYFHVITPPTDTTHGLAMMWHISALDHQLYYIDVMLKRNADLWGTLRIRHLATDGSDLSAYDQDITLDQDTTSHHTRTEIPHYQYLGYGYSDLGQNPPMSEPGTTKTITYTYDPLKQDHYLTFYYRLDPLSPPITTQGAIQISSDQFDVGLGIPTGEHVDIQVTVPNPELIDYRQKRVTGSQNFTVTVDQPYVLRYTDTVTRFHQNPCLDSNLDGLINPLDDACTGHTSREPVVERGTLKASFDINRTYAYSAIDTLYHYRLTNANVYNPKINHIDPIMLEATLTGFTPPDVVVKNYEAVDQHLKQPDPLGPYTTYDKRTQTFKVALPSKTYYQRSLPLLDLRPTAESSLGQFSVRNDLIKVGQRLVMTDAWHSRETPLPLPLPDIPQTKLSLDAHYLDHQLTNGLGQTSGTLNYALMHAINYTDTLGQVRLSGNPVKLHTPVLVEARFQDQSSFDQSLKPLQDHISLPLDLPTQIQVTTLGQHLPIKGYGLRQYADYLKFKRIQFPFPIYLSREKGDLEGLPQPAFYHEAQTWISLDPSVDTYYIKVPYWVKEGGYECFVQAVTKNHRTPATYETHANLDDQNDIAIQGMQVQVSGRLFDLTVTEVTDPRWQTLFRDTPGGKQHSGKIFTIGQNNKNGLTRLIFRNRLSPWPYTLPLAPGANTSPGGQDLGVGMGYTMRFHLKSMGSHAEKDDLVLLRPRFKHFDPVSGVTTDVDLYYRHGPSLVRLGSSNPHLLTYARLQDPHRLLSIDDLIATADTIAYLGEERTGDTRESYIENSLKSHYLYKPHVIVLSKAFRTFIGSRSGLPATVDPHEAKAGVQMWYGQYALPAQTLVVPKDTPLNQLYNQSNTTLTTGYLIMSFEIVLVDQLRVNDPVLAYVSPRANEWLIEGYTSTRNGQVYTSGEVIWYDLSKNASHDVDVDRE